MPAPKLKHLRDLGKPPVPRPWTCPWNGVYDVAVSSDGREIVGANYHTNVVIFWDAATGARLRTFRAQQGDIRDVQFHPDGRSVVSFDDRGRFKWWNKDTGKDVAKLAIDECDGIVVSHDAPLLFVVRRDRTATVWDLATRQIVVELGKLEGRFAGAAFFPGDAAIAIASCRGADYNDREGLLRVVELPSGKELARLDKLPPLECVAVTRDGEHVVAGDSGANVHVHLWRWRDGTHAALDATTKQEGPDQVRAVRAGPSGIICSVTAHEFRTWDGGARRVIARSVESDGQVLTTVYFLSATVAPDGSFAILCPQSGELVRHDIASGGQLSPPVRGQHVDTRIVDLVVTAPDELRAIDASGSCMTLDARSGAMTREVQLSREVRDAFVIAGTATAIVANAAGVDVWDLTSGRQARSFAATSEDHGFFRVGPGPTANSFIAVTFGNVVYRGEPDGDALALAFEIPFGDDGADDVVVAPGGRCVVSYGGETRVTALWDAATGERNVLADADDACGATFSLDGARLATAHKTGYLQVFSVETCERFARVNLRPTWAERELLDNGHRYVMAIDGERVILGVPGEGVRIVELVTRKVGVQAYWRQRELSVLCPSPDGAWIASGAAEGAVALWQVPGARAAGKAKPAR